MDSDPQYLSDKTSSFEDFKNNSFKFITYLCIILAPIIMAHYLYLIITNQIQVKFNLILLVPSIVLSLFFFFVSLIVFRSNKEIRKLIERTDWKIWRYKGKYKFAFSVAFRALAYAIVIIAISNYIIGLIDDYDLSSDGSSILSILIPAFLGGLSVGINAWNIKMEEENTLFNKLFSTRLY